MNRPSDTNLAKLTYFLCILLGAIMLFSAESLPDQYKAYITIIGFVLLMFGLYKSTTSWVKDNPREKKEKDTFVFYEEDPSEKKQNEI